MRTSKTFLAMAVLGALAAPMAARAEIRATKVSAELSKLPLGAEIWKSVPTETVPMTAQPMIPPRPEKTTTELLKVQAVHDGERIAFRLRWKDKAKDEAGRLGKFSDAVAIQFPATDGAPPPVFMGAKDAPVHIFHWRAQYQLDRETGGPDMARLYPNMAPDMYPMEFKDPGNLKNLTEEARETYSHARAAGNPQAYPKLNAVDEIVAEGFGTSSVVPGVNSFADGKWAKGEWSVVIVRPMARKDLSTLKPGGQSFVGFAVWQGSESEVGARKSVTMSWTPLSIDNSGGALK